MRSGKEHERKRRRSTLRERLCDRRALTGKNHHDEPICEETCNSAISSVVDSGRSLCQLTTNNHDKYQTSGALGPPSSFLIFVFLFVVRYCSPPHVCLYCIRNSTKRVLCLVVTGTLSFVCLDNFGLAFVVFETY